MPISHYLTSPFILVVNPSLPVNTALEFIKYAKEQTTPLVFSSPAGVGVPSFAVDEMARRFGLKFNQVSYRSSPQSIVDIASGHINFAMAEAGASQALIVDGKLRALAVSSKQRLPAHPSSRRLRKPPTRRATKSWHGTCWWGAPARRSRSSSV